MATKIFCDRCAQEIPNSVRDEYRISVTLTVTNTRGYGNDEPTIVNKDFCVNCRRNLVKALEKMPEEVKP